MKWKINICFLFMLKVNGEIRAANKATDDGRQTVDDPLRLPSVLRRLSIHIHSFI